MKTTREIKPTSGNRKFMVFENGRKIGMFLTIGEARSYIAELNARDAQPVELRPIDILRDQQRAERAERRSAEEAAQDYELCTIGRLL